MELMTQEIITALPTLYATDGVAADKREVVAKFFTPDSEFTWYVFEGEKQGNGDYLFFGYVCGQFKEMGYFHLSELEQVRGGLGLPVERDIAVDPGTLLIDLDADFKHKYMDDSEDA